MSHSIAFAAFFILRSNLFILLHQNLLHTSSFSSTSARPRSPRTTKSRRNSNEQSAIQKDSVHSTLGSSTISGLLSPIWFIVRLHFHHWIEYTIPSICFGSINESVVYPLSSEPIAVLLEDKRINASSKGHD